MSWQYGSMMTRKWCRWSGKASSAPADIAPAVWNGRKKTSASVRSSGSRSKTRISRVFVIACCITKTEKSFWKKVKKGVDKPGRVC